MPQLDSTRVQSQSWPAPRVGGTIERWAAKRLYVEKGDERQSLLSKLPPAETGGVVGSNPDGRCAPLDFPGGTETINAEFYSEESYGHIPYQFVPRQIEPRFR